MARGNSTALRIEDNQRKAAETKAEADEDAKAVANLEARQARESKMFGKDDAPTLGHVASQARLFEMKEGADGEAGPAKPKTRSAGLGLAANRKGNSMGRG